MYSIFKDMLYHLCVSSYKLQFNAEIYHFPYKMPALKLKVSLVSI